MGKLKEQHLKRAGIVIGALLAFTLLGCFVPEEKFEVPKEPESTAHSWKEISDISTYIESDNALVRDTAVSVVADAPGGIDANSEEWKIWQINYWVYENICYVSDPKGQEYYARATETLQTEAGDCDDFAILLAGMYESVGLDAAIAEVDTEGTGKANHMACLVYYSKTADSFLEEEEMILRKVRKTSPTSELHIRYTGAPTSSLSKYNSGIWIFIDPPMAEVKNLPGYISHEPYDIISIVDVGG